VVKLVDAPDSKSGSARSVGSSPTARTIFSVLPAAFFPFQEAIMAHDQVTIRTPDGECPAHVFTPATGDGPWPAVIFYMDAFAIRPALFGMAQRLADAGHVVLLPDLFYRFGGYEALVPKELFKGDFRAVIGPMMASTDNHRAGRDDTGAFIGYLDTRDDVAGEKIGTVGLCMGGGMALSAAGFFPDRIAAVASFHGGRLATDDPLSPHRLAAEIQAELYVAGADKDDAYPPEQEARLKAALDEAGVRYRAEIYPGASHGWMKPDFPIYDEAAAERGWGEMLPLFQRNLG
jgi:carboxymethylenebutenolidase